MLAGGCQDIECPADVGGEVEFRVFPTDCHGRLRGRVSDEIASRRVVQQLGLITDITHHDLHTHGAGPSPPTGTVRKCANRETRTLLLPVLS
jgi:hypothetical protein